MIDGQGTTTPKRPYRRRVTPDAPRQDESVSLAAGQGGREKETRPQPMTASPAIWMILGALIAGLVVVLGLVVAGSGEPMPLPTAIPRAQASPVSSTPDFAATATADAYKNERVPRISPAEARQAQAAQGALLVDVRGQSFYREHHIAGAINMPLDEMPARLGELPRDRDVILYCS